MKEDDGRGILLRRKSEEDTSMNTSFQLRKSLVLTFIVVISLMTYFFNLSVGHDELESAVGAGVAAASSLIVFFLFGWSYGMKLSPGHRQSMRRE